MSTIEPDDVVVATADVLSTTVDDEVVLLNHDTGTYHGLCGVAPRIWETIQAPTVVAEVADDVLGEHDVDAERCRHDVTAFLDEMAEASLIEVRDGRTG